MSINLLMRAGILQRIVALRTVRIALIDPRLDSNRKVLKALDAVDASLATATEELANYPEDDALPAENEDGGYIDRDELRNAVKGDLGGFE